MGILNITPNSFSDGGEFLDTQKALDRAFEMVENGADIIDIGAESSRPGSSPISEKEELDRILPVLRLIVKKIPVPISVDTYKPPVADAVLHEGAEIINDISAFIEYPQMADVIAKHNAGAILMHMQGKPCNMQANPQYSDVVETIKSFLQRQVGNAVKSGIPKERIIIDPGIGFGKSISHNLLILKHLSAFKSIGVPVLTGTSRKSFIGKILDIPTNERLEGTIATVCMSIINGAQIVRVHDVKGVKKAAVVTDAIMRA